MNRFGISDLGFRIDGGNVIGSIFLTISYELSPGTESALTRSLEPDQYLFNPKSEI
jgi:hypothetical protein